MYCIYVYRYCCMITFVTLTEASAKFLAFLKNGIAWTLEIMGNELIKIIFSMRLCVN